MSSTLDLEVGWRRDAQGGIYRLVVEVVVQRTGKWRRSGRESLVGHEARRASAMVCSLGDLECREEKEKEGRGIRLTWRHASGHVQKEEKEKKGEVRYGNEAEGREPTRVQEKEGCTV